MKVKDLIKELLEVDGNKDIMLDIEISGIELFASDITMFKLDYGDETIVIFKVVGDGDVL